MKLSFKLILLAVAVSFASCKNGERKDSDSKTEYADADKDDANAIIEYNNVLVGFTDKNNEYLKRLETTLLSIGKGLENPTDRFAFIGVIAPFSSTYFSVSKVKPDTPPSALNSKDQKFFKENVAGLNTTMSKIKETYKLLDEYIKAEDWKDDKSIKGKALIDSIYVMSKKYYEYDSKILDKLDVIGDDAERIILKDHPLKEYIFALKDDRKAVADFNKSIVGNQNYKQIEEEIKAQYSTLETQNKKHTEMAPPDASKFPGRDSEFKRFNESFNEYLIEARKIMRDASADGKLTETNIEDLNRKQDDMRTAYNNFVD